MNAIINKLFPSPCVICSRVGEPICNSCIKNKIFVSWNTYCPVCNGRVKLGLIHEECRESTNLDGHVFVARYDEGVKKLIMDGKYSYVYSNFNFIGKIMSKFLRFYNFPKDSILVAIPSTARKRRLRGFNQSEIICKILSRNSSLEYKNILLKIKDITSQATLSGEDRRVNLKDSFKINISEIKNINLTRKILLIDDVFTTGSTLNECAKILKEFGFKEVIGFTFAKA